MAAPVAPCPVRRVVRSQHKLLALPKLAVNADVTRGTLRSGGASAPAVAEVAHVVNGRLRGTRIDRFFRDIHGIESAGSHALVLGRVRRHAAGDDAAWRCWTVACADRGGTRPR